MEAFHPFDPQARRPSPPDPAPDFVPEIATIISFMQRHNYLDLATFFNNEFRSVKKFTLSEKNLKFLDDLSKFCSLSFSLDGF